MRGPIELSLLSCYVHTLALHLWCVCMCLCVRVCVCVCVCVHRVQAF